MRVLSRLAPDQVEAVLRMANAAAEADGVFPLSEHVVLHMRHGGDVAAQHVLAESDGELVGYAHVDVTDQVAGSSAEFVVHPAHRRHGLGRALGEAVVSTSPDGRMRFWAHGEHPGAEALAKAERYERSRLLWQMRRSLLSPLPEPTYADDVTVRTFVMGQDEFAWLGLNARAFADHPEQGKWKYADLQARMAEPWFDPAGFFLAERDGELVGFHWTKVHGSSTVNGHAHNPLGEIYVLGVDPDAHGGGLGKSLALTGLRYLRGRGLTQALLYVDVTNFAAVGLYTKLGFAHWSTDVEYQFAPKASS